MAKLSLQALLSVLNTLFSRISQLERNLISKFKPSSLNKIETLTVMNSKHYSVSLFYSTDKYYYRQVPAEDKIFLTPRT